MKKIQIAIYTILCSILLSGCIKFDVALEINRDATVSGDIVFALSDSLASLGGGGSNEDNLVSESINTEANGVTASEYKEGGFTGTKYSFDRVPFEEFNKNGTSDENALKLIKDGNKLTVKGILDFSTEEVDQDTDTFGEEFAANILSSFDINISIKFPVKVLESTGTISEDGRTVTWKPKWGEKVDLTTTVEIPSTSPILIVIGIVALLILITVGIILLSKNRIKKKK